MVVEDVKKLRLNEEVAALRELVQMQHEEIALLKQELAAARDTDTRSLTYEVLQHEEDEHNGYGHVVQVVRTVEGSFRQIERLTSGRPGVGQRGVIVNMPWPR